MSALRLWIGVALFGATGCGWLAELGLADREARPEFSHDAHIDAAGMECIDCHATSLTSSVAGMPAVSDCVECHEDDEDASTRQRVSALVAAGKLGWSRLADLDAEVIFSHALHAKAKVTCDTCHGAIAKSISVTMSVRSAMDDCLSCHADRALGGDCAVCHREIRRDSLLDTHGTTWTLQHGAVVLSGLTDQTRHRCEMCHSESACGSCHLSQPPRDHTTFWRRRGHGVHASLDRERCVTCHRADSCVACHQIARPMSHGATWSKKPMYGHCVDCHVDPSGAGCPTCHPSSDAHSTAPPLTVYWRTSHPVIRQPCDSCHEIR